MYPVYPETACPARNANADLLPALPRVSCPASAQLRKGWQGWWCNRRYLRGPLWILSPSTILRPKTAPRLDSTAPDQRPDFNGPPKKSFVCTLFISMRAPEIEPKPFIGQSSYRTSMLHPEQRAVRYAVMEGQVRGCAGVRVRGCVASGTPSS